MGAALLGLSFVRPTAPPGAPTGRTDALDAAFVPVLVPWALRVPQGATRTLRDALDRAADDLRERLFRQLGLPLPSVQIVLAPGVAAGTAELVVHERPEGPELPLPDESDPKGAARTVIDAVEPVLRRRAASLLGIAEVQGLLDRLERARPGIVRQVIPKTVSVSALTEVLRALLDEGVSVRDLSRILETLSRLPSASRDDADRTEAVRRGLADQITADLVGESRALPAIVLDGIVEDTLEDAVVEADGRRALALSPATSREITSAIVAAAQSHPQAVVVTRPETRRFVRQLVRRRRPDLPVVAATELAEDVRLDTVSTVRPG
jgi:type III secretory pathway component EscV